MATNRAELVEHRRALDSLEMAVDEIDTEIRAVAACLEKIRKQQRKLKPKPAKRQKSAE